jgi:hypothetical protein
VLNLKNCSVEDGDLDHLKGLQELRMLYVKGTSVTAEGAAKLKKSISGLAVFFY